jgi:hypothetical protein
LNLDSLGSEDNCGVGTWRDQSELAFVTHRPRLSLPQFLAAAARLHRRERAI